MGSLHEGDGLLVNEKSPLLDTESSLSNNPKCSKIKDAITKKDIVSLRALSLDRGGLLKDELRREAWPILLNIDPELPLEKPTEEEIKKHTYYEQVCRIIS